METQASWQNLGFDLCVAKKEGTEEQRQSLIVAQLEQTRVGREREERASEVNVLERDGSLMRGEKNGGQEGRRERSHTIE